MSKKIVGILLAIVVLGVVLYVFQKVEWKTEKVSFFAFDAEISYPAELFFGDFGSSNKTIAGYGIDTLDDLQKASEAIIINQTGSNSLDEAVERFDEFLFNSPQFTDFVTDSGLRGKEIYDENGWIILVEVPKSYWREGAQSTEETSLIIFASINESVLFERRLAEKIVKTFAVVQPEEL